MKIFCLKSCSLFILLLSYFLCRAQPAPQLVLIDSLKSFIKTNTSLTIRDSFYTNWADTATRMFLFVYVSPTDSIQSALDAPFKYFDNEDSASAFIAEQQALGFETLLYKTAGASSALLNNTLLSYPPEAIAFIVFHEAAHQHIRSRDSLIAYDYEEALCDVIANTLCKEFSLKTKLIVLSKTKLQQRIFERCYRLLNKQIAIRHSTDKSRKKLREQCSRKIAMMVNNGNQFHKDRMLYSVNNAYLLRLRSYSLHYFTIKRYLQQLNNIDKTIEILLNGKIK